MIGKSKPINFCIGPKAIFDPNYVPPEILHRKKEEVNLYSILKDSVSDEFSLNVLYQGIQGIGKKVIINKVLQDLLKKEDTFIDFIKIPIDCKEKSINEIVFSIITDISSFTNIKVDYLQFLNCNLSELWNIFKLICNKTRNNLILVFNNVEHLKPEYYKKFLHYGKESKISSISTVNKILKPETLDLINKFDLKKKLSYYNYHELFDIIEQRVALTFINGIDNELIEFITDLIFEHYVPVPGKGIEILRELYPLLSHQNIINNLEIIEILQNQFDSIHLSDEFAMLTYISEEDILTLIFLDNLANFFLKRPNYYISIDELKELYYISCESLEYNKRMDEFYELIKALHSIGVLSFSKRINQTLLKSDQKNLLNNKFYFMAINPKQLKAIVDAIFSKF